MSSSQSSAPLSATMTPNTMPALYSRLTSDMTTGGDELPIARLGVGLDALSQVDTSLNSRLWDLYAVDSSAEELNELAVVSFLIRRP